MSVTIRPDEAHLGYAPERESWDPAFTGESDWTPCDECGAGRCCSEPREDEC